MTLTKRLSPTTITGVLIVLTGCIILGISFFARMSPQHIKAQIEDNLQFELNSQDQYIDLVSKDWSRLGDKYHVSSRYPTFIFSTKKLVVWNTANTYLDFELLARLDTFGILNLDYSKFLYKRQVISKNDRKYILVSLLPIERSFGIANQYLKSKPNKHLFPQDIFLQDQASEGSVNIEVNGMYLVSFDPARSRIFPPLAEFCLELFSVGLMFLMIYFIYQLSIGYLAKFGLLISFMLAFLLLAVHRFLFIGLNFPFELTQTELFNSSVFVASDVNPSLGDFFMNICSLLVLALILFGERHSLAKRIVRIQSEFRKYAIFNLLILASCLALFWFGYNILKILSNSQIELDLSLSLQFDDLRIVAFLAIIISGLIAFLILHLSYKVIFYDYANWPEKLFRSSMLSIVSMVLLGFLYDELFFTILFFIIPYLLIIAYNDLPARMRNLKFGSLLYILMAVILFSGLGSFCIYKGYEQKELIQKQKFSTRLLIDRDIEGEFLLDKIAEQVKNDIE